LGPSNPRFLNLDFLIIVMIIDSDKIVRIKNEDISEILIVKYYDVWGIITFNIKLKNGTYLIPYKVFYVINSNSVDVRQYTMFFIHSKIFSSNYIKKLILKEDLIFLNSKFNRSYSMLQKITIDDRN